MDKERLEKKIKAMKMPELKTFLQDRGITVNGYLKTGLVAIACAVEDMPCSPAQLSAIVDSMEQMKSKPVVMSVLAKQVHCYGEIFANSKQHDGINHYQKLATKWPPPECLFTYDVYKMSSDF